jgi:hypothetical protein
MRRLNWRDTRTAPVNASLDDNPEPTLQSHLVSENYFALLGVNPILGRPIGPEDNRVPNGQPVVMVSYGYWQRRFGGETSVLDRTVRLSGVPFTIIGSRRRNSSAWKSELQPTFSFR